MGALKTIIALGAALLMNISTLLAGEISVKLDYDALTVRDAIDKALAKHDTGIESGAIRQNEEGIYKGKLQSFIKTIHSGDGVLDTLKFYAVEDGVPLIRGGVWEAARVQYIFYIIENDDETTNLRIAIDLSGFESYVTARPHSAPSNGDLEQRIFDDIKAILEN